jgi:exosortase family protein XrtM
MATADKSDAGDGLSTALRSIPVLWHVTKFVLTMTALEYAYDLTHDTLFERIVIDHLTVTPAALWIDYVLHCLRYVGAYDHVAAQGHSIVLGTMQGSTKLNILGGCEGVEGMFLLLSAIVAFPTTLRKKAIGMWAGIPLMYCLNQVRILALLSALHWRQTWFEPLHVTVAPGVIILIGSLSFLWWSSGAVQQNAAT